MFTSKNPFTLVASRARRVLQDLETRLRTGQLTTRTELLGALLSGLSRFTGSLREPTMQVRPMTKDDLLIRELVEVPLGQADEDTALGWEQLEDLRLLLRQVFNVCQAERAGLTDQLAEATALVDGFRLWVSDSDPTFMWAGDSFNDRSKTDPGATAFLDPGAGVVTLPTTSSRSLTDRLVAASIDRDLSEGGLPGNNTEIRSPGVEAFTGETPAPIPVRFRDTNQTGSLTALWDDDPATWFEWERVFVPVPQPVIHAGKALVADPAGVPNPDLARLPNWNCFIRWPGEAQLDTGELRKGHPLVTFEGTNLPVQPRAKKTKAGKKKRGQAIATVKPGERPDLVLALTLTLDQPQPVSWIQLTPLVKGGTYPVVEQILISNDGQRWREILAEPTTLHPRMNRGVDFTDQNVAASNFEGIGVWTLPATPIQYVKFLLRQSQAYATPLGIAHTFWNKVGAKDHPKKVHRVWGPVDVVGDYAAVPGDQVDIEGDLTSPHAKLRQKFDIFRADRQVIAIRDLLLEERLFAAEAQHVSLPYALDRAAKAVALITEERIPEEWGPAADDGGPWIRYEVSPDGATWFPIVPQRQQLQDSVVEFPELTRAVTLRATLRRPADAENQSPVLNNYALKLLPA